jgi:Domain of unknown function (DUF4062)
MRTGQVFVSHTGDMAQFPEDRSFTQAALDAVARAGLTAVDMRYFAARDDEPAAYCRARVRECAIFIAVVGFRYGSMVPGETVSFTELEFLAASAAGLPRLVFLLEETASGPDGRADADRDAVDGFRQRLRDAGLVVRSFISGPGLELEVFHALSELTADVRDDMVTYLTSLIEWVNTDPWPRDRRFGGPVLTPAAIERKLRVTAPGRLGEEDLDADELAQQFRRLVVLGGPGSGKTWLAKRTARRCAESALRAMAGGAGLDEVELPLYTTCSRLFSAHGGIREAAVTSTLEQLGDLSGARLSGALRAFFAERNAPTVLVIDSLDESHGSQERLRQADTLPWRIVLTTRPSSWNQQLAINDADDSSGVGELQPLRYPEDVEPFVHRWFAQEPERGADLAAQIARRPGLQQAATVPLILAFYCIVGGREPLPDFRRDLFARVINRMLTGRWRADDDRRPDVDTCLRTLRRWAWPGPQECHPVSGVGTWTDDILTGQARLSQTDQDALDHIAMPLSPADVDTGQTLRRFIHRSIREHLAAEFAAGLPRDRAAQVLLPHLWYDPDWEYSAPAAIAMHPEHEQLLRDLICLAAQSGQVPGDLSVIGAGLEIRWLLARLVAESSESDWSPDTAELITRARAELAGAGRGDALSGAAHWAASNLSVRQTLLGLLAGQAPGRAPDKLVNGAVQLSTTAEDRRQTRDALLSLLPADGDGYDAARSTAIVVGGLVQLAATPQDKHQTRDALLRLLSHQADGWIADKLVTGVSGLSPTESDKHQLREALLGLVPSQSESWEAVWLVGRTARLAITAEDRRQTRDALLRLLPGQADGWLADEIRANVNRLSYAVAEPAGWTGSAAPAADAGRPALSPLLESLAAATDSRAAAGLAAQLIRAGPADGEKRQARAVLLGLLAAETRGRPAAELAGAMLQLDPAGQDNRRIRDLLLRLLPGEQNSGSAAWLSDDIIAAGPTAADKRQARGALLRLLAGQQHGSQVARLASRISKLDPTADDSQQTRDILLRVLASTADATAAGQLAGWISRLSPTAADTRQTRQTLLKLLAVQTDPPAAQELAGWLTRLDTTAQDRRLSADALLRLLAGCTDHVLASGLLSTLVQLAASPGDRRYLCDVLLGLLADTGSPLADTLLAGLLDLTVTADDKRHTSGALLKLLSTGQASAYETAGLVTAVTRLAATADARRDALGALLGQLDEHTDGWVASELAAGVIELGPSAQDKRRARHCLLALLAGQASAPAARLVDRLAQLDPTASDITTWPTWASPPTRELLAAVRRNSGLAAWLSEIPSLATLSALP